MSRFALITNGVVTNIVEQDDLPPADFHSVETLEANIGWTFDGVNFIAPVQPEPTPLTFAQKRQALYPPIQDLADGIVKQHSDDPIVKAEGDAQVADYAAKCLAIKASIPKETA